MFHNNYGIYIGAIESTLILGAYKKTGTPVGVKNEKNNFQSVVSGCAPRTPLHDRIAKNRPEIKKDQVPAFPRASGLNHRLFCLLLFQHQPIESHLSAGDLFVLPFREGCQLFLPHNFISSGDRQILRLVHHRQKQVMLLVILKVVSSQSDKLHPDICPDIQRNADRHDVLKRHPFRTPFSPGCPADAKTHRQLHLGNAFLVQYQLDCLSNAVGHCDLQLHPDLGVLSKEGILLHSCLRLRLCAKAMTALVPILYFRLSGRLSIFICCVCIASLLDGERYTAFFDMVPGIGAQAFCLPVCSLDIWLNIQAEVPFHIGVPTALQRIRKRRRSITTAVSTPAFSSAVTSASTVARKIRSPAVVHAG